ncbi:Mannosylglycerate hydrolase [Pontiella desulfatans]|uniref:Mannosylglycerate hydrolase n=1 Tax=Pontiella desulfatans TaxID=2750659 RepID=A0A6C2U8A2_PONDE|nr:glycoside hydrolase family 38 C-terminal domain-containing protein [Pontiella desulfatans]VGO15636.1 Mannosylglycerate hydrolase [Pontiella desulfatans]
MKEFHVISHTHWDREWYQPFEEMRLRLLDLVDNLLAIFEQQPDYVFHMDAQIVCLEDYLEVRPHRRADIARHIREGRLLVGPWYVQNDFNLCSGEATVRNLLIGSTLAEEWGACQRVGYAPDQFGLTGQLPQIYAGFGVFHTLAARGYRFYERAEDGALRQKTMPMEFDWIGADGTRMNSVNLACWYNNAQRFPSDDSKAWAYLRLVEENLEPISSTPTKLLMNGVDHLEPQDDLLPILDGLQKRLGEAAQIKQSTMIECLEKIAADFEGRAKPEIQGELRHGDTTLILQGTLSSRPYLKLLNMQCQNLLELVLEPLYTHLAQWSGGAVEYPADMLDYLWKELQKNHAHDSICGCSADRVHQDNENRFMRILDAANELRRRGLNHLVQRIDRKGMDSDGYILTVANTLPYERAEMVEAELHPLLDDGFESFSLIDEKGKAIDFELLATGEGNRCLFTPCNLPGQKRVHNHRIRFRLAVPAGGYRTLRLYRNAKEAEVASTLRPAPQGWVMQNEFMRVVVGADGQVDLLDSETGIESPDIFGFEDVADVGESYWFTPDPGAAPIDCTGNPEVAIVGERGVRLTYAFGVRLHLWLDAGCRHLAVSAEVDNRRENHRLRLLVHTDVHSDECLSSQPFDCVRRSGSPPFPDLRDDWTEPNNGLVSVKDWNKQFSIFNNGIYEYEHLRDARGTIALTLMRSTARIANDPMCCQDTHAPDPMWDAPENQCLRKVSYRLAIRPGQATEAALMREMQGFQVPLLAVFDAVDSRKFSGGRPYVGEPGLQEYWHRLPGDPEINFPLQREGLALDEKAVFSALKRAHDRAAWILRFFNPAENAMVAEAPKLEARVSDLDERTGGAEWSAGMKVGAKKIVTLRFTKRIGETNDND